MQLSSDKLPIVLPSSRHDAKPIVGCIPFFMSNEQQTKSKKFKSLFGVYIVNKETDECLKEQPSVLSNEERNKLTDVLNKDLPEQDYLWLKEIASKLDSVGAKIKTFGMYFMVNHQQP